MSTETLLAGRYRLVRPLGGGGAGEVWECVDEASDQHGASNRRVAVKTMELRPGGQRFVEPFGEEARMVGLLGHPGIARVHDAGVDGSTAYLVTERLYGRTLGELVAEEGHLPVEQASRLTDELLSALAAAHATGVIHRRVKPSNVVVDEHGSVRVLDFGVAALAESGALTSPVAARGADDARYLAPEQVAGLGADARTDLYAVGCLVTEMLTGKPPFTGGTAVDVVDSHVHAKAPWLAAQRPDVPVVLDELVGRMLAKDPAERPASAEEARLAMRAGESFSSGVVPGLADRQDPPGPPEPPTRRWSVLLPVYVVVALALVVGALVFAGTGGRALLDLL